MGKLSNWRVNRIGNHKKRKLDKAIPCYFETLEGRQLLSLLGVSPGYPQIFFDTTGKITYTYNSTTKQGDFVATATPHTITFNQGGTAYSIASGANGASFTINFLVNSTGGVISSQTGPNLIVDGSVTDPNTHQVDNGVLLEGTISQFGFQYTGTTTNFFDFRFTSYAPNPGLLASYFSGDDIGVSLLSQGNSFKGSFTSNWSGGANDGAGADGTLGPIPELPPALGSLAGFVYEDTDDNGMFTGTDTPLNNIQVILTGTDYLGNPVDLITTTGPNGSYLFSNLEPSSAAGYTITENQATVPAPLIEGTDSIGTLGGNAGVQDVFSGIPLAAGANGVRYDFGELPPSQISGYVYFDANDNGVKDSNEPGIGGATVTITGVNDLGQSVSETTTTLTAPDNSGDQIGFYQFTGLRPSPTGYTITETTPVGYNDGTDNVGSGWTFISQSQDQFVVTTPGILPVAGAIGTQYNFGNILGSISGTVWFDSNQDGVQESGEPDVSGVTVQLIQNNAIVATALTNSNGGFDFTNLLAGSYQVNVIPPNGEAFTVQTAYQNGGSTVNSVVNTGTGLSPTIVLPAGQNDTNVDAGLILGSISGTVWFDTNQNGVQDSSEPDVSGVTVNLIQNSAIIATETTDANGYFDFTSLPAGTYQIQAIAPNGEAFTIQTAYQNGGSTINSVVDTGTGLSPTIALAAGQNDTNVDAGLILGSISGTVWFDTNDNGVQDSSEPDVSGVTVQLIQNNNVIATEATDANGYFDFTSLPAGTYQIQVIAPSGEAFTIQTPYQNGGSTINSVVTAAGLSPAIALAAGQNDTNVDAGLVLGSISGTVWFDTNDNGVQDSSEPDVSGVTVQLIQNNNVIATQTTNPNGYFDFTGLFAGTYQVQVIAPTGEAFTIQTAYQNGGSTVNSVVDTGTGLSPTIALAAGQNDTNVDAGLILGSISGTVWFDTNQSGIQDAGEPDVSGVTIQLIQNNNVIATETTNANGYFDFTSLPAGTYQIQVIAPTGEAFTIQTAYQTGGSTINSVVTAAGLSPAISLAAGQNDTNVDAGLILGSISGTVWMDSNANGVQDSAEPDVSGVTVELTQNNNVIATQTTNASGYFDFTSLPAGTYQIQVIAPTGEAFTIQTAYQNGGSTVNSVVNTATGQSSAIALAAGQNETNVDAGLILGSISGTVWFDTNQSGVQDSGEPDVSGVTVQLIQNNNVIATETTDTNGYFDFTSLPAGTYQIQVIAPSGEAFTIQTAYQNGGSTINSVVTAAGLSPAISLAAGQNDTNVDAGLVLGSISGTVWFDLNDNGVQDAGEPNLSGITVQLVQNNNVIATQTTDANGAFDFTSLPAGSYQIEVTTQNGESFTIQTAYQNGGSTVNSIVNAAGLSGAIALPAGQNDTNADAGLLPVDLSVTKTVNNSTPNVGADVTYTVTVSNGSGYSTATNVALSDMLPAGETLVTATPSVGTFSGGVWSIPSLAAGSSATLTYVASVNVFAPQKNTATITGADQYDVGAPLAASVTVNPEEIDLNVVKTVNNATPNVGTGITYTITVSNAAGFSTATNVVLSDLLPNSEILVTATPSQGVYNSGTGVWNVGTIAAGGSVTMTISALVSGASFPSVTNTATVTSSDQPDVNPNPTSSVTVYPQQIDLLVTKVVDNPTPLVGQNVTYTVTVSNATGFSTATDVVLSDLLPVGMVLVSDSASQGTYNAVTGVWTIGTLAAGQEVTLVTTATATQAAFPLVTNTATVTGADQPEVNPAPAGDLTASATVAPQEIDLSVTKTVNNSTPNVGANVTYTVTVSNATGYDTGTNISLTDLLPAGETLVSATPATGTFSGGIWSIPTLASGASTTLTYVATVNTLPAKTNTATITGADEPDIGSPLSASVTVNPVEIDLSVTKTVNNSTPNVGANVTYTVTVGNATGYSTATNVSLTDLLPSGETLVSATPSVGTFTSGVWSIPTLASGASATLSYVATVNTIGAKTNTATITSATQPDIGSPLSASATVTPVEIDLSVTKTVNNSTPNVGANVTYTVTVSNATGYSTATNVSLTDLLPSGETLVSATPSVGTFTSAVWTIPSLASGASATLSYVATVNTLGAKTNTATITSATQPDIGSPLSASATVTPVEIDLSVTKTVNNSTPNVGANVTYTVTVSNATGYSTATNVSLTDLLPSGETLVSATPSVGTFTSGVWSIPTLASGASATLSYVATVNTFGAKTNTATITSATQPDIGSPLTASVTVNPQEIDLSVTKTVSDVAQNCSIPCNFNGTGIGSGSNLWFNCNLNPTIPAGCTSVTYSFTNCQINFSANNVKYCINAPNASVTYSSTCTTATTTYNSATNCWVTTCPISGLAGNTFLNGCTFNAPTGLPGGIQNVTWCGHLAASQPNCSAQWQWAAACYNSSFSSNYNNLGVKPCDDNQASSYKNSDHCGTPENCKTYVCGGATGGGGSNCTGSYSGTGSCSNLPPSTGMVNVGDTVQYVVTVSNATGYDTATDVVLKDLLPAGETFGAATASQGTYNATTGIWSIGTLASGSTATLTYTAIITTTAPVTNTATITGADQTDIGSPLSASATVNPISDSISGTVYNDTTGNGLTADDTPLAGVVVNLYKDANGNGVLDASDGSPIATLTVGANGYYSFTNLAFGKYIVTETVPSGSTETAPNVPSYYPVSVSNGTNLTNLNFDNYHACTTVLQNVCFTVQGSSTQLSDLRGNTLQGETVTATFTVPAGSSAMLYSLVSYNAPSAVWDATVAYEQTIYQDSSGTFGPGTHTLTVTIPNNYYQIDFVCGAAINTFGAAGSNITYSSEGRLISADNEGNNSNVQGLSAATSFWASASEGQALIKSFGGSASSTALGNWLASTLPNIFGGSALGNKSNTAVAAAYMTYYNASGQKNTAQLMSTALSVYASTSSLGGSYSASYGFAATTAGLGAAQFNVGNNGSAFNVANGTTITVTAMLSAANSKSAGNSLYSGSSTLLNEAFNEFGQVNADGGLS